MADPSVSRLVSWSALRDVDPAQVGGLVVEYATAARSADHDSSADRATAIVTSIQPALLAAADGRRPATPASTLPAWLTEAIAWRISNPLQVPVADAVSVRALERLGLYPPEPGLHQSPVDHTIAMLWLPASWSDQPAEQVRLTRVQAGRLVNRLLHLEVPWSENKYSNRSHGPLIAELANHPGSRRAMIAAAIAGWDEDNDKRRVTWLIALVDGLTPSNQEWERHTGSLRAQAHSGRYRQLRRTAKAALSQIGVAAPKRDYLAVVADDLRRLASRDPQLREYARARIDPGILGGLLAECGSRIETVRNPDRWKLYHRRRKAIQLAVAAAIEGRSPAKTMTTPPVWVRSTLRELVRGPGIHVDEEDFACLRVVELSGLLELEVDEGYVAAMLAGLSECSIWAGRTPMTIPKWFAADPGLVERGLWRIFDLTRSGLVNLTNLELDANESDRTSWLAALIEMSEQGVLDRPRLLDACLNTLATDWPPARLRWFNALLAGLRPTAAEIDGRQTAYRQLLGSTATPVITLGLEALIGIDERGGLDDDATLSMLWPVLTSAPKTQAMRGLRLLDSICRRVTDDRPLQLLLDALGHPQRDVQQAAGKRLIAAAGQQKLLQLAAGYELDPIVRGQLGLPVVPAPAMVPVAPLVDLPKLQPVTAIDLLDRFAALLERPDDPIELELVLDRLAQTTDAKVIAPLSKRAKTILKRGEQFWDGDTSLAGHLAGLVVAASGGAAPLIKLPADPIERFLALRLREVEQVLVGSRPPRRLVATPDDPAGWVSAEALVARLHDADLGRAADLVAALLRLSPHGRTEALAGVGDDHQLAAIVRHALGARPEPSTPLDHPDLWVAASRSRAPMADDPLLIMRGLDRDGQGRALNPQLESVHKGKNRHWKLRVRSAHPIRNGCELQPTALGVAPRDSWSSFEDVWTDWAATVWLQEADHPLVHRIGPFSSQVVWSASPPGRLLPVLLRHPGRLGPLSALTLALGLSSQNAEERVLAADLLIDVTARGRLTTAEIADAMAFAGEPCIFTRWASALAIAAEGGAGAAVAEILTSLLPELPSSKTGMYALLELLAAEQLRLGPVRDRALRGWLARFSGSSKAARAARTLLA